MFGMDCLINRQTSTIFSMVESVTTGVPIISAKTLMIFGKLLPLAPTTNWLLARTRSHSSPCMFCASTSSPSAGTGKKFNQTGNKGWPLNTGSCPTGKQCTAILPIAPTQLSLQGFVSSSGSRSCWLPAFDSVWKRIDRRSSTCGSRVFLAMAHTPIPKIDEWRRVVTSDFAYCTA